MTATEPARGGLEPDLSVALGPMRLPHPVLNASGTFDLLEAAARYEGDLVAEFPFAAYVPKTVTLERRDGQPAAARHRDAGRHDQLDRPANPGLEAYLRRPGAARGAGRAGHRERRRPRARGLRHRRRASRGVARPPARRASAPTCAAYELNVSCPNVATGLAIGADAAATADLVARVKAVTGRFVIVKLTPNVTSVVEVALAAEAAGADGLSLVNTFKAMVLDGETLHTVPWRRHRRSLRPGDQADRSAHGRRGRRAPCTCRSSAWGASPAGRDALEFIACGATAVQVGAVNFTGIDAPRRLVAELGDEMRRRGIARLAEVRGRAALPPRA